MQNWLQLLRNTGSDMSFAQKVSHQNCCSSKLEDTYVKIIQTG